MQGWTKLRIKMFRNQSRTLKFYQTFCEHLTPETSNTSNTDHIHYKNRICWSFEANVLKLTVCVLGVCYWLHCALMYAYIYNLCKSYQSTTCLFSQVRFGKILKYYLMHGVINSLWIIDAIWRYRTGSILAQFGLMPDRTKPYCLLTYHQVNWQSSEGNFHRQSKISM